LVAVFSAIFYVPVHRSGVWLPCLALLAFVHALFSYQHVFVTILPLFAPCFVLATLPGIFFALFQPVVVHSGKV